VWQHQNHTKKIHWTDFPRPLWVNKFQHQLQWGWSAWYTHGPQTHGRQISTRSGDKVLEVRLHLSVSMMGGRGLGEYKFWNYANSSSISGRVITLTEGIIYFCFCYWMSRLNFGNPTSAPLIVLVVTITPLPLLNHVRTFYIARYTSPTTYLSHPTYTFNELQTKEKEKETKEKRNLEWRSRVK